MARLPLPAGLSGPGQPLQGEGSGEWGSSWPLSYQTETSCTRWCRWDPEWHWGAGSSLSSSGADGSGQAMDAQVRGSEAHSARRRASKLAPQPHQHHGLPTGLCSCLWHLLLQELATGPHRSLREGSTPKAQGPRSVHPPVATDTAVSVN